MLNAVDLDSHFGYDLLILQKHHLTGAEEPAFVELKFNLRDRDDFNHSFEHLMALVCWETKLIPDDEIVDIQYSRWRKQTTSDPTPSTFLTIHPVDGISK